MPIGALAAQTGVKVPTIRYYEDLGLIQPGRSTARALGLAAPEVEGLAVYGPAPETTPDVTLHDLRTRHARPVYGEGRCGRTVSGSRSGKRSPSARSRR